MDIFVKVARMIGEIMDVKVVCLSEIRGHDLYFLSVYVQGEIHVNAGFCPLEITPCATVRKQRHPCLSECHGDFSKGCFS